MQKFPFDADSLKSWFQKTKRSLPWREQPTPYAVWISEVMLQQTQVAVVQGYFQRWMTRFPTVESLAAASLEEVIKIWEGLGYYSRARHLHAAAQFLVDHHGGALPGSKELLAEIKGIGPYTIGAILSLAFQQKAAAVDGNVVRVLTRYFAISDDVQKGKTMKKIWEIAESILPDVQPWLVVEGLIELGAMVCKREPLCHQCPLQKSCLAHRLKLQQELPKKGKKVEITLLSRDVFVVIHHNELLLKKGKEGKLMAGLYEFPYVDRKEKKQPFPFALQKLKVLDEVEQSFTRYRARLYPVLWEAQEKQEVADCEWIPISLVRHYAFSAGHRKILEAFFNERE